VNILDNYIVAYIDILGYIELVNKSYRDSNIIKNIDVLLKNILTEIEDYSKRPDSTDFIKAVKQVYKKINIKIFSDTMLITLPLSNLNFSDDLQSEHGEDIKDELVFLLVYFWTVSQIILKFSSLVGYFFRGCISLGQYYENNLDNHGNKFMGVSA